MATKKVAAPTVADIAAEIAALRVVGEPTRVDDAGATIAELALVRYGRANAHACDKMAKVLKELLVEGRVVRGVRFKEDLSGRVQRVTVFRMTTPGAR